MQTVSAWQEGDRLSQPQLDAVNLDTVSYACKEENVSLETARVHPVISIDHSCLRVAKDTTPTRPYFVYRERYTAAEFSVEQIVGCFFTRSINHCAAFYQNVLTNNRVEKKKEIRESVRRFQTGRLPENPEQYFHIPDENG